MRAQARRQPQRDPGKHSRGVPQTFSRAPSRKKFFSLKVMHSGVIYISARRRFPQNVARDGVAYPSPSTPPSREACITALVYCMLFYSIYLKISPRDH